MGGQKKYSKKYFEKNAKSKSEIEIQNPKNGKFYLLVGCFENDEIITDLCCGTWTSYDGKIMRKIRVKKIE